MFARCACAVLVCFAAAATDATAGEWKPLFNGEDLTGWVGVEGDASNWGARDGLLVGSGGKGARWLSTTNIYTDFQLELEFKLPEGGNSGVFIRAPREGNGAYAGMEIELLDDYSPKYADIRPVQFTGSLYDVVASSPRVSKQAGQWQTMKILCNGPHVQVTLNGTVVVDTLTLDHAEHYEKHPGLLAKGGYIGLQNHGSEVQFRNVRIRELD